MNIAELQLQLHQVIDTVTDADRLEAIYTLLKDSKDSHKKMSLEEYIGAIDEAREQIKEGNFLSTDELEKQSESW
tara:strand:- start:133 stop:357 length:225 start_codon:yes stop_codon:yes gene_type:complete